MTHAEAIWWLLRAFWTLTSAVIGLKRLLIDGNTDGAAGWIALFCVGVEDL